MNAVGEFYDADSGQSELLLAVNLTNPVYGLTQSIAPPLRGDEHIRVQDHAHSFSPRPTYRGARALCDSERFRPYLQQNLDPGSVRIHAP